ncbi:MAG: hypothetical protein A2822_03240 [Candidatus Staskawiczbacteria bacterium RIFCSPHIGHO2_01_FULL_41_41]|uniref:Uncharacterized protein n=1 Tax=Candidatus Staskawiczbacteria bacterium RIFCSPHIGHO2_01_FULL_41_41 TaxID=1802203 RepID=A0A1G2HWK7_9BACT|nr:MAG: hypothetical protein A2822_03240 [Candidatus Staskawiczbacteria bacterium RIFCSPHIGHO2_01_FULL_41_41]HLD79561.1 hypothetical protein [Candidatus Nanoarchaeia archaeon]
MNLDLLLLQREELPILHGTSFYVPIHPDLLKEDIRLDPEIAKGVFPQAAQEYHQDLAAYIETMQDEKEKKWYKEVFHKDPTVQTEHGRQSVLNGMWEDLAFTTDTGFAHALSINRNVGGTLFFNGEDRQCTRSYVFPPIVNFTPEKFEAYAVKETSLAELSTIKTKGVYVNAYDQHNIDHYPGALFLRNWAILYLNAALKELHQRKQPEPRIGGCEDF